MGRGEILNRLHSFYIQRRCDRWGHALSRPFRSARMRPMASRSGGRSSRTVRQMTSVSTPKYSWTILSLIPAIPRQATCGCLFRNSSGTCFAASPMTSSARITANDVRSSSRSAPADGMPSRNRSAFAAQSRMSRRQPRSHARLSRAEGDDAEGDATPKGTLLVLLSYSPRLYGDCFLQRILRNDPARIAGSRP